MKLTYENIKSAVCGAAKVWEEDGFTHFRRFTEEESECYGRYRQEGYKQRTYNSASIRLAFVTDSARIAFNYRFLTTPCRDLGCFDVAVNGALVHYTAVEKGVLEGSADIALGCGEKTVEIYFPWSKGMSLADVTLDDGATFAPKKRRLKMINFGDSITHGYVALNPSLSYANQLGVLLDADGMNKAIGGDRFFPELMECESGMTDPDIITVAYGINDWACHTRATVERRCRDFYFALSKKYPMAKIFAVSPIWSDRVNTPPEKFGDVLTAVDPIIRAATEDLANVTVIDGMTLAPNLGGFYTDGVHPNDLGMGVYARNLALAIKRYL